MCRHLSSEKRFALGADACCAPLVAALAAIASATTRARRVAVTRDTSASEVAGRRDDSRAWNSGEGRWVAEIMFRVLLRQLLVAALIAGCTRDDRARGAVDSRGMPDASAARPYRSGVRFDPSGIKSGDSIAGLVVDSVALRRAYDSTLLGDVRFRGEVALSGRTMRHPDHPDFRAVCFEADSASGERLPRWMGDERRAWFCFEDREAERLLAPPGVERDASVVVDRFTIHMGMSDEVNGARLVRVVRP